MLYGGHGGGKTTLAKYLGQIFCHLSKDKIEDCILRGHPQLTEESRRARIWAEVKGATQQAWLGEGQGEHGELKSSQSGREHRQGGRMGC